MSPSPQLAPAGSSNYHSDTMTVGDGTWDASTNTFLLPNLVGLNFDTMRYNGKQRMGNRFRQMPGYHNQILAHGILAAITFLLIVPSAILFLRFSRNPRLALRYHIWLQVLTLLLTTVVFVLGWIAVGPSRKLSNPHHGIGLTIFILVLFQFFFGWWMSRRERKHRALYEPLKVMLHHWLGRAIALLGIVQVALGLTLYGSPVALFVLYALVVFALLLIYFILTHLRERGYSGGSDYGSRYSYGTESVVQGTPSKQRRSGSGKLIKGAIAGAGLYALADRFRSRRKSEPGPNGYSPGGYGPGQRPEVLMSGRPSGSFLEDEKYSQYGRDQHRGDRWGDRLMKVAAPIGAAGLAARFLDRRHRDDDDSEHYGPPLGGATAIHEERSDFHPAPGAPLPPPQIGPYNRPPSGPGMAAAALPTGQHPLNRPHSSSSMTYSSYLSESHHHREHHGLRDGIATLGVLGFARSLFKRRRDRSHAEQDTVAGGGVFTGDNRPPRHHHRNTSSIGSDSSLTGSHPVTAHGIPPLPAGSFPAGSAAAAAALDRERIERERRENEPLPLGGVPRPVSMPPMPPDPVGVLHRDDTVRRDDTSGSESFASPGGRGHHRHHSGRKAAAAGLAGGAAGLMAGEALGRRHNRSESRHSESIIDDEEARYRPPHNEEHLAPPPGGPLSSHAGPAVQTPPVSVKVKMYDKGRKVTLRRLPEEEARAEREANRAARTSRRRDHSVSSLSGSDVGGRPGQRFRRDRQEQQNAEAMRIESERLADARAHAASSSGQQQPYHGQHTAADDSSPADYPAPPPIPDASPRPGPPGSGMGSGVGSPGYDGGTSGGSDYAAQRRRRRAERAQTAGGQGKKTVGFSE